MNEALERLEGDDVVREAMGDTLSEAFTAVRRAEVDRLGGQPDEAVVAAGRWIH